MLEYTKIEPPVEIRAAEDSVLYGTAQGILLIIVRGTDGVLQKVKLPIVLVPGLKRNLFSGLIAGRKRVKAVIENSGSFRDLGPLRFQLIRLYNMDPLYMTIAKQRRTESALIVQFQTNRVVRSLQKRL